MNVKNEIKSIIVRSGMTMQQVVDLLSEEYGWSDSISNFSNKLTRAYGAFSRPHAPRRK